MFLPETLLLTCAVVTCKIMTSFSATEPDQNETSHSTLTSIKPLDLKLPSTIAKRWTHPGLAEEQGDPASRGVSGNSADGQSQLLDGEQHGLAFTNASVEGSHSNLSFASSKISHTPEVNSPNDSATSTDMYNRSDINDAHRPCIDSSNCLEKATINVYSTSVSSPEHNYSNINDRGSNETNANTEVNPETTVYFSATTMFAASSQRFGQMTDTRPGRGSAVTTESPQAKTSAPSQPHSSGDDSVILGVGGQMLAVCELDMLCRDRCLQGTDDTYVDREATSPRVVRPDTMTNFQDTTYTYPESASGGSLHESSMNKHRRLAWIDAYSRQSRKLQTFLDEYYNPWESNEESSQPIVKPGLDNSNEAPRHCSNFGNMTCFCDVVCVLYGDCCPDVFTSCFHLNTSQDILTFISSVWRHHFGSLPADYPVGKPQSAVDVVVRFASCQKTNATTGTLLVSKCPEDTRDKSLKTNCEHSSEMQLPPVTGNLQQGELAYRNIFCSRCHGVKDTDVQVWTTQYVCETNVIGQSGISLTISDLRELVRTGVCNISFVPPMDTCQPRQCQTYSRLSDEQKIVIKMNVQERICSQADAMLCRSYYYPKSGFTNAHCRICLEGKQRRRRESQDETSCDVDLYRYRQQFKQQPPTYIRGGILLILDVTGAFSGGGRSSTTYVCQQEEVFDPMLLACRSLTCPVGFRPYVGRCRQVPGQYFREGASQIFPAGWRQLVLTIETHNAFGLPCEISTAVVTDNFSFTELNISAIHSLAVSDEDALSYFSSPECQITIKEKDRFREIVAQIVTCVFFSLPETLDQIPALIMELDNLGFLNHSYQIEISNINSSTASSYRCSGNNSIHQVRNFSVVENDGTVYALVNTSGREIYYPLRNVGLQVTLSRDCDLSTTWVLNRSVYVCDTWLTLRDNCSVVAYKLNDTRQNGSRLMILSSGLYYDDGDFQVSGDEVLVCTNFSFQYELVTGASHQSLVYLILTWTLTIISVVSLLLMLMLYCLFPQLRTLPGRMTASLAATMMLTFVSNLFTAMELHHDCICPIAAVLSHVISLAQFGWMSAIAVNMALTFGPLNKTLARTVSDKVLFLRYNLVVWGSSIAVVMTAVVLDLTHPEPNISEIAMGNYPHYGYPYCTWFSGPMWTKLAFVMVPYLITFVISLVGFLLTLTYIQRTSKSIQKLGKKSSDKSRCMIYLKLSSAMGFSWAISALSSIYPNVAVLPYIYLCLILLQGLLLFLSFMVNHRVYVLIVGKFCLKRDACSTTGTTDNSIVMTLSE